MLVLVEPLESALQQRIVHLTQQALRLPSIFQIPICLPLSPLLLLRQSSASNFAEEAERM